MYEGSSPQFSKVNVLTTLENDANLIICVPKTPGQITLDTLHDNIKNGIKSFKEEKSYAPNEVSVWLPQFKV